MTSSTLSKQAIVFTDCDTTWCGFANTADGSYLGPGVGAYWKKVLVKVLRSMLGVMIETIGFDKDHVHMVMGHSAKIQHRKREGTAESQSASALKGRYAWLRRVSWKENSIWSPGYFMSSVRVDEELSKTMSRTKDNRIEVNSA